MKPAASWLSPVDFSLASVAKSVIISTTETAAETWTYGRRGLHKHAHAQHANAHMHMHMCMCMYHWTDERMQAV